MRGPTVFTKRFIPEFVGELNWSCLSSMREDHNEDRGGGTRTVSPRKIKKSEFYNMDLLSDLFNKQILSHPSMEDII